MPPTEPAIFDGHNDALLKLFRAGVAEPHRLFIDGYDAHVDLPKARAGGFGGGFFAIFVPPNEATDFSGMAKPEYDLPLPSQMNWEEALPAALGQAGILLRLQGEGVLKICRTAGEIAACLETATPAAVMHMEGAEAIDRDFRTLDVLYEAGLRSLGPVWSRPTLFAHGVPFRFPSTGDTGPGLTDAGHELVRVCNDKLIMIDLSHLNEAGFWDVAKSSNQPLVATHSNAHALCPHARNLTDRQLAAIRESDGMVGLNFATAFLRPDGQMKPETDLDNMMRHLDHLIEHLGEDRVGFGSDFDGAMVPRPIGSISGLPALRQAMRDHGVDEPLMTKLTHGNWLRVLKLTWGE
jgi:membrane dipeptidase